MWSMLTVLERLHVAFEIVVERDAVETQVGPQRALLGSAVEVAALDVIDAGRAERPCGLRGVAGPPCQVDVGGIVGANRGSDRRTIEEPLAKRQRMVRAGRHEHDVDESLTSDQPHLLAVLLERLEPDLAGMHLGRLARRAQPQRHVGVLGVGQDEFTAVRIGMDRGELAVERLDHLSDLRVPGPGPGPDPRW